MYPVVLEACLGAEEGVGDAQLETAGALQSGGLGAVHALANLFGRGGHGVII